MGRIANWDRVLMQELDAPPVFAWGVCDCTIWAADMRAALRSEASPADLWRGKYSSRFGAVRIMRTFGWRSLEDAARNLYGDPDNRMGRGDLVMDETSNGHAFGICYGRRVGFVAANGLVFRAPTASAMTWRT